MATKYFENFPAEAKSPLWTNPCDDKRHLEILPEGRQQKCKNLPNFIILGPQKTGTTALMSFLKVRLAILVKLLWCSSSNAFLVPPNDRIVL